MTIQQFKSRHYDYFDILIVDILIVDILTFDIMIIDILCVCPFFNHFWPFFDHFWPFIDHYWYIFDNDDSLLWKMDRIPHFLIENGPNTLFFDKKIFNSITGLIIESIQFDNYRNIPSNSEYKYFRFDNARA